MNTLEWYADWQSQEHARQFDYRSTLDARNLIRNYESFNDVCLLQEGLDRTRSFILLEVGCATGEFYRYLRLQYPNLTYYGIDVSEPAIARAKEKYPAGRFFVNKPEVRLFDTLSELPLPRTLEVVYAKDVVHHQTRPFDLLSDFLQVASDMLVFRCRTRDVGPTEWNPDLSRQYHYGGWMPYIVINLDELIAHILRQIPESEVIACRNRMVLGGQYNRYLPNDCYLEVTGTAETAIAVLKKTNRPGRFVVEDRPDMNPEYTFDYRLKRYLRHLFKMLLR